MHMDAMKLKKLEKLNQLRLEENEREDILAFLKRQRRTWAYLIR